jgi:hypothetical protein
MSSSEAQQFDMVESASDSDVFTPVKKVMSACSVYLDAFAELVHG